MIEVFLIANTTMIIVNTTVLLIVCTQIMKEVKGNEKRI